MYYLPYWCFFPVNLWSSYFQTKHSSHTLLSVSLDSQIPPTNSLYLKFVLRSQKMMMMKRKEWLHWSSMRTWMPMKTNLKLTWKPMKMMRISGQLLVPIADGAWLWVINELSCGIFVEIVGTFLLHFFLLLPILWNLYSKAGEGAVN